MLYGLILLASVSRLLPHPPTLHALPRPVSLQVVICAAVVYASIALSVLIGSTVRISGSLPRLLTASLAMSTLFFLITHGAVWASGMYSYDFVGMVKTTSPRCRSFNTPLRVTSVSAV